MKNLLIGVVGLVIIGASGYIGYEAIGSKDSVDPDIQVAKKQSSNTNGVVDESTTSTDSENQGDPDTTTNQTKENNNSLDDTYPIVLVFADGTKRLAKAAPTSQFWQRGTSSSYGNGHTGRTSYNQIAPQVGGVPQNEKQNSEFEAQSQQIKSDFESNTQSMMENSVPFQD